MRTRRKITVDVSETGWPENSVSERTKLCCTQNIAVCDGLAIWRGQESKGHVRITGYYCDDHLPGDYADALGEDT